MQPLAKRPSVDLVIARAQAAAGSVLERLAVLRAATVPLIVAPTFSVPDTAASRSLAASVLLERLRGRGADDDNDDDDEIEVANVMEAVPPPVDPTAQKEANARAVVRALAAARNTSSQAAAVSAAGVTALESAVVAAPPPRDATTTNAVSPARSPPSLGGFAPPTRAILGGFTPSTHVTRTAPIAIAAAAPLAQLAAPPPPPPPQNSASLTTARPILAYASLRPWAPQGLPSPPRGDVPPPRAAHHHRDIDSVPSLAASGPVGPPSRPTVTVVGGGGSAEGLQEQTDIGVLREEELSIPSPLVSVSFPTTSARSSSKDGHSPKFPQQPPQNPQLASLAAAGTAVKGLKKATTRLRSELSAMLVSTGAALEGLVAGAASVAIRSATVTRAALTRAEAGEATIATISASLSDSQRQVVSLTATIASQRIALARAATVERAMRDTLSQLTASVRVVLRTRPMIASDVRRDDSPTTVAIRWALARYAAGSGNGNGGNASDISGIGAAAGLTPDAFVRALGWWESAPALRAALARGSSGVTGGGNGSGSGAPLGILGALSAVDIAPVAVVLEPTRDEMKSRLVLLPPVGADVLWTKEGGVTTAMLNRTLGVRAAADGSVFSFDRIFSPGSVQADVFSELVPLLESSLLGRPATLLTYGATGSGKSHTLVGGAWPTDAISTNQLLHECAARDLFKAEREGEGGGVKAAAAAISRGVETGPGVVPRALVWLIDALASEAEGAPRAEGAPAPPPRTLMMSVFEVYNDEIRDLLLDKEKEIVGNSLVVGATGTAKGREGKSKAVSSSLPTSGKEATVGGADGTAFLTVVTVVDVVETLRLLFRALSRRAEASTIANASSSRGHAIVRFTIRGAPLRPAPWAESLGAALGARVPQGAGGVGGTTTVIQLVDLAGAERARESRAAGTALVETCAVNASLSALSDCVTAVVARAAHVPFRNTRLTRVLESSLSGAARCLVVLTASLAVPHKDAATATLRFGAQLAGTKIGRPEASLVTSALEGYFSGL